MRGEKVAIVGESGKGKTTVLNLIVRLISPQKGIIKFNGIDIDDYSTDTSGQDRLSFSD